MIVQPDLQLMAMRDQSRHHIAARPIAPDRPVLVHCKDSAVRCNLPDEMDSPSGDWQADRHLPNLRTCQTAPADAAAHLPWRSSLQAVGGMLLAHPSFKSGRSAGDLPGKAKLPPLPDHAAPQAMHTFDLPIAGWLTHPNKDQLDAKVQAQANE